MFEPLSLSGQIIVNANNVLDSSGQALPDEAYISGKVVVPTGDVNDPELTFAVPYTNGPTPTPGFELPRYGAFPGVFGGGAVGLVPFAVHSTYSAFLNEDINIAGITTLPITPTNVNYPCDQRVTLEFYGPLAAFDPSDSPVRLFAIDSPFATRDFATENIFVRGGPLNRQLRWRTMPFIALPLGTWNVLSHAAGVEPPFALRCNVPGTPFVASINEEYEVALICRDETGQYDCTGGGTTNPGCLLEFTVFFCNDIDFNNDGLFPDDFDLPDFLAVLSGGVCSTGHCDPIDFNNDGLFPADEDLLSFLSVLAGGPCLYSPPV
jgi:hypothetical protein